MSECFYCQKSTVVHPTCDYPGCSAQVHGHGSEGKRRYSYCPSCRSGESA